MDLHIIEGEFSVCKVEKITPDMINASFSFIANTPEESSVICLTKNIANDCLIREDGWLCFRIAEDASFEKYGMISFLANVISAQKTATLVVETYDTDYLFVKKDKFEQVKEKLLEKNCKFI